MGVVQARWDSNRAAARAVGVDERTWRRWLTGTTHPRPASQARLDQEALRVRADALQVRFRRVRFDQDMGRDQRRGRAADTRGLDYDPAANDRVAQAARRGDWGAAAAAWWAGIRDQTYARMFGPEGGLDSNYGITVTAIDV
jgi:hypothetical protein